MAWEKNQTMRTGIADNMMELSRSQLAAVEGGSNPPDECDVRVILLDGTSLDCRQLLEEAKKQFRQMHAALKEPAEWLPAVP